MLPAVALYDCNWKIKLLTAAFFALLRCCCSGCYHPETYTRYRSGQSAWCSNGARIYCDWGNWQGSCRGGWSNGNDGVWRR